MQAPALPSQQQQPKPAAASSKAGFSLGFNAANELLVGRLAMLGFGSSLVGEVLSGKGALAQLGYDIGLPTPTVAAALGGLIAFNLVAAFLPGAATDSAAAPASSKAGSQQAAVGPLQDPKISLLQPKRFFGITSPGFTAPNELFVGRLAALGFLASVLGELATGKGPLAQFGLETGIPLMDTEAGLLALIGLMLFTAVGPRPRDA